MRFQEPETQREFGAALWAENQMDEMMKLSVQVSVADMAHGTPTWHFFQQNRFKSVFTIVWFSFYQREVEHLENSFLRPFNITSSAQLFLRKSYSLSPPLRETRYPWRKTKLKQTSRQRETYNFGGFFWPNTRKAEEWCKHRGLTTQN